MQLVIEDEWFARERRLQALGVRDDATIVASSRDAITLLHLDRFAQWTEIWFDFDLSGMDSSANVAQLLAEYAFHGLVDEFPLCVIHTHNPVGRENLVAVFTRWNIPHKQVWL